MNFNDGIFLSQKSSDSKDKIGHIGTLCSKLRNYWSLFKMPDAAYRLLADFDWWLLSC